jgi:FkbM family methyltransferase
MSHHLMPPKLRAFFAKSIRRTLAPLGYDILDRNRFYNPFLDIEKLSRRWNFSIDLFFDVGANQGMTTEIALRHFPNVRVVAFEPHPETFVQLQRHYQDHKNVELVNSALGKEVRESILYEYNDDGLTNSLLPDAQFAVRRARSAINKIPVSCTTVDRFCRERSIKKIDVLKIDTEGFELEVVQGASEMLAQHAIRCVYFEFNDIQPQSGRSGGALVPIDQVLRAYGYRFIATYTDFVLWDIDPLVVSNALYLLPPREHKN